MAEFGSLSDVFGGSQYRQRRAAPFDVRSVDRLRSIRRLMLLLLRTRVAERPVLGNWHALLDYLAIEYGAWPMERARILYLNTRNLLIRDELVSVGSISEAAIYVEAVVRRALELGAASIIVVHNHPSGDVSPSKSDIALTRRLRDAGALIDVSLHDHLIVGGGRHASMRSLGLI